MRIIVRDDAGTECFSYDTNKDSLCLCPARHEKPEIIAALAEAARFLTEPPQLKA
jgi:hypothetical protein